MDRAMLPSNATAQDHLLHQSLKRAGGNEILTHSGGHHRRVCRQLPLRMESPYFAAIRSRAPDDCSRQTAEIRCT